MNTIKNYSLGICVCALLFFSVQLFAQSRNPSLPEGQYYVQPMATAQESIPPTQNTARQNEQVGNRQLAGQQQLITQQEQPCQLNQTPGAPEQIGQPAVQMQSTVPQQRQAPPVPPQPEFFPLVQYDARYRITGDIAKLSKIGVMGVFSDYSWLKLNVRKEKNNEWIMDSSICEGKDGKIKLSEYHTSMNNNADVFQEVATYFEPNRLIIHRIIVKPQQDYLFGDMKAVVFYNNSAGGNPAETMVGKNDTITTLTQIIYWCSTIRNLPQEGYTFRWVAMGQPIPVRIFLVSRDRQYDVFKLYKIAYTQNRRENYQEIAMIWLPSGRQCCTLPDHIEFYFDKVRLRYDIEPSQNFNQNQNQNQNQRRNGWR